MNIMSKKTKSADSKKTGPKPERLYLVGNWTALVKKSLVRERPAAGWRKPKTAKRK